MKSIKTINIDLRLPSSNDSIKDWLLHHCYVEFRYTKIESITDWIVRILTLGFLITVFSVCCFVMWMVRLCSVRYSNWLFYNILL
jgi:hypothetical protein